MQNRYTQRVKELKGENLGWIHGKQPIHVSEEEMREIEQQLGATLPADYREFIRDYGDYSFSHGVAFPVKPNSYGPSSGALEKVYGAVLSRLNYGSGLVSKYHAFCKVDGWSRNWLPIAAAGRDDRIVLSVAGEDKGAVYLFVEYLWEDTKNILPVADSFDEFMQLLYLLPDD